MIAKALFLAKNIHRYCVLIFRDHENRSAEYPTGYLCEVNRLPGSPRRALAPARPCPSLLSLPDGDGGEPGGGDRGDAEEQEQQRRRR